MANQLQSILSSLGWTVVRLSGPQNVAQIFSMALSSNPDADLVCYMGHAGPDVLLGEDYLDLAGGIINVSDVGQAKGRILIGLPACESAQQLGPAAVNAGALGYVGSIEDMCAQYAEEEHDYMADWFDYTLTFYRTLATELNNGASIADALAKALSDYQNRCTYYMDYYQSNLNTWPNADYYLYATKQNRDYVVDFISQKQQ
jgi:hypothetical protein